MSEYRPINDPRELRAIAHPLRNRILTELEARGPLRAADIARELEIPANQASFHLRQLAKYGLVVEDPDAARDRRDRVWKLASEHGLTLNLRELEEQPGGRAAVSVFRRRAGAWAHAAVDLAYSGANQDGHAHVSTADHAVRLTAEEAQALAEELDAVVRSWSHRTRGREEGENYLVFRIVEPYPTAWGAEDGED